MAMPHEGSIFCETCSVFNIQSTTCIIIDGKAYCEGCIYRMGFEEQLKELIRNMKVSSPGGKP